LKATSTISFWVSGLCSPFVTFGARAEAFLQAVRNGGQEAIQTAINTGFGECFASGGGDVPEWAEVREHQGAYRKGELPGGAIHPVMTIDVQTNRIYYVIRGWGARATSWLIDWGVLWGDTVEQATWTDLADLVTTPVCGVPLRLVLIDSGFRPGKRSELPLNRGYDFCRRFPRFVNAQRINAPARPANTPGPVPDAVEVVGTGAVPEWRQGSLMQRVTAPRQPQGFIGARPGWFDR
jgi:Phage terminase large subunit (GpA)